MNKNIHIKKVSPFSEVSLQFIDELSAEVAARYDFQMDGKGAFSPEEVNVEKAGFYVIYSEETPVGCGALRPLFNYEIAEVKRMFVQKAFRGRGIAKMILSHLENEATSFGYRKIWLETGDRQPEAIQLYQKSGYSRIKNYGIYKANLHSNCFEKQLIKI